MNYTWSTFLSRVHDDDIHISLSVSVHLPRFFASATTRHNSSSRTPSDVTVPPLFLLSRPPRWLVNNVVEKILLPALLHPLSATE